MVLFPGCLWCRVQRRAVFLEAKPRFIEGVLLGEIPEGSMGRQRYPGSNHVTPGYEGSSTMWQILENVHPFVASKVESIDP